METRILRSFLTLGLLFLAVDWILGVARFRSDVAQFAFLGVNLPSSLWFNWLDQQPALWWRHVLFLEPEIGSAIAFMLMISVQALLWSFGLSARGVIRDQRAG